MQKKIIIVEDERAISKALQLKLEHEGFEVDTAFDGEEGLVKLSEKEFDLILLDLIMPKMDGFPFMMKMREREIGFKPIIVLSNLSQPEDKTKAKALGAIDFVIKSDTPLSDIVKIVQNVLK